MALQHPPAPVVLKQLHDLPSPGPLEDLQHLQEVADRDAGIAGFQSTDGLLAEAGAVAQLLLGDPAPDPCGAQRGPEALRCRQGLGGMPANAGVQRPPRVPACAGTSAV